MRAKVAFLAVVDDKNTKEERATLKIVRNVKNAFRDSSSTTNCDLNDANANKKNCSEHFSRTIKPGQVRNWHATLVKYNISTLIIGTEGVHL